MLDQELGARLLQIEEGLAYLRRREEAREAQEVARIRGLLLRWPSAEVERLAKEFQAEQTEHLAPTPSDSHTPAEGTPYQTLWDRIMAP